MLNKGKIYKEWSLYQKIMLANVFQKKAAKQYYYKLSTHIQNQFDINFISILQT